jgi:hypothetical protein
MNYSVKGINIGAVLSLLACLPGANAQTPSPRYDLVLKGGHVIDPANHIDAAMDVAVSGGKIAAVAKEIPATSAGKVVDVSGLYVTPGLIDIHYHVGVGGAPLNWFDPESRSHESPLGIPADLALQSGVTTVVDAGTSGGIWGLQEGYCLMVGGPAEVCTRLEPIFLTLAPTDGYLRVGGHGAGHYVKMIHNGIEYGLMQAYAEGFELMHASDYGVDLGAVAKLWNQGSVVRSWLLELTGRALAEDPELSALKGYVEDSGEGRWTLHEAIDRGVPLPVMTAALFTRFRSREDNPFSERMLAALRNQFGGHAVKKSS